MRFMRARPFTVQEQDQWEEEKALWGLEQELPKEQEESIEVWPENWDAIKWWLSIPGFLKWNQHVCIGLDALAVKADSELSGREVDPCQYMQLKTIARVLSEELNRHE